VPRSGACKLRGLKRGLHSIGHEPPCRCPPPPPWWRCQLIGGFSGQFGLVPHIYRVQSRAISARLDPIEAEGTTGDGSPKWQTLLFCLTLLRGSPYHTIL
jgi:hypothetical protein